MKNDGPKLPEGSMCSQWEGINVVTLASGSDVSCCNGCSAEKSCYAIRVGSTQLRLCRDCLESLYTQLGNNFFEGE